MKSILTICLLLFAVLGIAQNGIVSGNLTDEVNAPLPGVNIIIKGTFNGTQTDFDGNYSIECKVGDVLVFSYVGFGNREQIVTREMFDGAITASAPQKEILPQINSAYGQSVLKNKKAVGVVPNVATGALPYTKGKPEDYLTSLKNISLSDTLVALTYFKPNIYYELAYRGVQGFKNISSSSIPDNVNHVFGQNINKQLHSIDVSLNHKQWEAFLASETGFEKDILGKNTNNSLNFSGKATRLFPEKDKLTSNFRYTKYNNNLANINGYQNLALLSFWNTSVANTSKTFLLNNTNSRVSAENLQADFQFLGRNSADLAYSLSSSILRTKEKEMYQISEGIFNYENDYSSIKRLANTQFLGRATLSTNTELGTPHLESNSKLSYSHETLDYEFNEQNGPSLFNRPLTSTRNAFKFENEATLELHNILDARISLYNTSYISSLQKNDFWTPMARAYFNLNQILDSYLFRELSFNIGYGETLQENHLLYKNRSHNSTQLTSNDAFNYTNRWDLFTDQSLALEKGRIFEIKSSNTLSTGRFTFELEGSYTLQENNQTVFPIWENNTFQLKNAVNSTVTSWDITVSSWLERYHDSNFSWNPEINFSSYRTRVDQLLVPGESISIAGFSDVGNRLIVGKPAGIIVGSSFARDENGTILYHKNGVAQMAEGTKIIGDPTPDYSLSFSNEFKLNKIALQFSCSYQKGGDIWNGTRQFLQDNNQQIAEEFIEDGSFFNMNLISLSYQFAKDENNQQKKPLFSSFKAKVYTYNPFSKSKTYNNAGNSNPFGGSSGQGLHFFNTPLITETGISIIAKI